MDQAPTAFSTDHAPLTRLDAHCHSSASSGAAAAFLKPLGVPECYSHPEQVFAQAKLRGMDLITLTDHDTIDGAMLLVERGYPNIIVGEEVTTRFPEDHCKLHVLVWCISPEQHEQLQVLRHDVYQFAAWLCEQQLPHALAHPLYAQNRRLTPWHLDRCALLFKGFETLNGAHAPTHRKALQAYLSSLTAGRVQRLMHEHALSPQWTRVWEKMHTGGSDDHGLLNIGRTWTELSLDAARAAGVPQQCISREGRVTCGREFFRAAMQGRSGVGGSAGSSNLLAHQLTTVTTHYLASRLRGAIAAGNGTPGRGSPLADLSPTARALTSTLFSFAGVHVQPPSRASLVADQFARRTWAGVHRGLHRAATCCLPPRLAARIAPPRASLLATLLPAAQAVLAQYPDLAARLHPDRWLDGSALSQHERMADFCDDVHAALHRALAPIAASAVRTQQLRPVLDTLGAYALLEAAQLPTIFSLFHQNKERRMVDQLLRDHSTSAASGASVAASPRVLLFTDTLGDVNGVSRFIRSAAAHAQETGRDLTVLTSTSFAVPDRSNIINCAPVLACPMPKYENLELALPPVLKMLRVADQLQPDVIHISTPGPIGLVGLMAAKMLRCPIVGVYHTDFPAYVDALFHDDSLAQGCRAFMRLFYRQFARIMTRSNDYAEILRSAGLNATTLHTLRPGIDLATFHPQARDPAVDALLAPGARPNQRHSPKSPPLRFLYCGRVSVEKNLPFLTRVWTLAHAQLQAANVAAELLVVGDGPYRASMQETLKGMNVRFLGFRHGTELSALYARSDLFLFPSTTDTLGQVVMESQASGVPVLVTDQGGPKNVVHDGVTGFVLPATDPQAWVRRIVQFALDPDLRRTMRSAAHAHLQQYSFAASFDHYWQMHVEAWQDGQRGTREPRTHAYSHAASAAPAPLEA